MNTFWLAIILWIPFCGLVWLGSHVFENWTSGKNYKGVLAIVWQGMPAVGTSPKVAGVKEKLAQNWFWLVPMIALPVVTILCIKMLGNIVTSIFIGVVIGFVTSWGDKTDFAKGAKIAFIFAIISIIFPNLFIGAFLWASVLFAVVGPVVFILEETTGKNLFPWVMIDICFTMIVVNIVSAVFLGVAGHSAYLTEITTAWNEFPIAKHFAAESIRGFTVLTQLVDMLMWFLAGLLIVIVSTPEELKNQMAKRKKDAKDEKTGGGFTIAHFAATDLLIELALFLLNKFIKKRT